MSDTYIGCKAHISTKSKFKYEGTISAINPLEMTICLAGVHIIEGPGKIDPNKEYSSVTFKSGDVLDLQVFEGEHPTSEERELVDPAILAFENEREEKKKGQDWLDPQFYNGPPKIGPYSNLPGSYVKEHPEANPKRSSPRKSPAKSNPSATAAALIEEEFDYSASTNLFEKQKQSSSGPISSAATGNSAGSTYNKKLSFFDNLMLEREDSGNRRDQIQQEKNRNLETFGVAAGPSAGRGGRGGYKGRSRRGRGHHHNI
jgi:hypothetical protein